MRLGAIADDVTGASDLASVLRRAGCRVVLTVGEPRVEPPEVDAMVFATKARMAPVAEARAIVDAAADYLTRLGADTLYFKYCSTFDSTAEGNIGPITDHLLDREGADFTIACPSYPQLARTVYQGHMFVGEQLLSDSPMRNHPLTPMDDANLVRFLSRQTASRVGLIPLADIEAGEAAVRKRIERLRGEGVRIAIVDGIFDRHIDTVGAACRDLRVATGGAALGGALARAKGIRPAQDAAPEPPLSGRVALLSGSCSAATQAQVARAKAHLPWRQLDALALSDGAIRAAIEWALAQTGPFLVYSTAEPQSVARAQAELGRDAAAQTLENAFAAIARALSDAGVRGFVVAGGETSGAVIRALDVRMLRIGDELAPGVPWTDTIDPEGYRLALKSGNFGGEDFFLRAIGMAP